MRGGSGDEDVDIVRALQAQPTAVEALSPRRSTFRVFRCPPLCPLHGGRKRN